MNVIDRAKIYREIIEQAVQSLTDNVALTAINLYPIWIENVAYTIGHKVQYNGKLWRCIQSHTSIIGWEPENAAALWEQINETHVGTIEDPIPYSGNMALENGKYYIENNVIYLCIRDTINPAYNYLSDLINIYVEVV